MSVYQRTALVATFCVVLGLAVAACGKKAPAVSPPPPAPPAAPAAPPAPPPPPAAPAPAPAPRALSEQEIFAQASMADIEKNFQDVYFDLDMSTIRSDARASLTANADYMKKWSSIRITIEGRLPD